MKPRNIALLFILIFSTIKMYGQDLIIADTTYFNFALDQSTLKNYTVDDCSGEAIYFQWAGLYHYRDFTYHPNGKLYANGTYIGNPFFVETTFNDNNYQEIPLSINTPGDYYALATSPTGNVFMAGTSMFRYQPSDGVVVDYGTIPTVCQIPQAMCFRLGEYFVITQTGELYKIDVFNPSEIDLVLTLPSSLSAVRGLSTVHYSCSDTETYFTAIENGIKSLYSIDFQNLTVNQVCETEVRIQALASEHEPLIPECEVFIDLDLNDDSGLVDFDYLSDTFCLSPVPVTDSDPIVYSETGLVDGVVVKLADAADTGYLSCDLSSELQIAGIGTSTLLIINDAGADFNDFSNVLKSIVYVSDVLSYGTIQVDFEIFASEYTNDAIAYLPIYPRELDVEGAVDNISCFGNIDGSIEILLPNGIVPFTAVWGGGATDTLYEGLSSGEYNVTVTDGGWCVGESSFEIIEPEILTAEINTVMDTICGTMGELTTIASGGTNPYTYNWSNLGTGNEQTDLTEGIYEVTVSDANNCEAIVEYELFTEAILFDLDTMICANEELIIGTETFTNDTIAEINLISYEGCDSIVSLNLSVLEVNMILNNEILCVGDTFWIDTDYFISDTIVSYTYGNVNSCDSIVTTEIAFFESSYTEQISICEGEIYTWQSMEYDTPGLYNDTISNFIGCDSILILELSFSIPDVVEIEQTGSLCGEGEVSLSVPDNYTFYSWSTGETTSAIIATSAGEYSLDIEDENGCLISSSIELTGNTVNTEYSISNPSCFEFLDGLIQIDETTGGLEPYMYSLNDDVFTGSTSFQDLPAGTYQLLTEDAEGCQNTVELILEQPQSIGLFAEEEEFLNLGDSLEITPFSNTTIFDSISWTPSEFVSCDTCLQTYIRPFESTRYVLRVTDENGCSDELAILATVDRNTEVYAPTAISPNFDGINDIFYLQSKHDLVINQFEIFDRWGNLIHSVKNGFTNDSDFGWDGFYSGEKVSMGVYVFMSKIILSDGSSLSLNGDITVF